MNWKALSVLAVALLVGALVGSADAAVVTVLDDQTINDGGSNVVLPFTGLASYDASAASKLVVTISSEDGFGDHLPTGVSFDGDAMTLAVTDNNSIQHAWMYYLDAVAAGGSFGTGDLVVEGSSDDDFTGALLALSGTMDGVADTNSASGQSVTIDTTLDGSIVVAAHVNNGSGATAQSPLTSILDSDAGSAGGGAGYAITDPAVTGGSYSFTGSTSRPLTVAAVFEPSAEDEGVIPEPTTLLIWTLLAVLGVGLRWRRRK